jgi:isopropylmalate/homocitrate/citramalate synthase
MHFHDTYGLALAASEAAYRGGVRLFDGSTGGIGGCPYAKGATGNAATDELAYAFHREGRGEFRLRETAEVFRYLRHELGLTVHSRLAEILEKGGSIHGSR